MKCLLPTLILFLVSTSLFSQSGVVTSGATVQTTAGSISYTIGQIDYLHTKANIGSLRAGIQQPFEITSVSVSELALELDISIYPNPTNGQISINTPILSKGELYYSLFDLSGKSIKNGRLQNHTNHLNLDQNSNGTYLLSIYSEDAFVQTFQIIKN